ncbi:tRNA-guanine transglycosylase DpdA [Akkermansiaceae bacterium]|nr:tRNA-guanine transglycosylase DpdA [Akkermansiaceae bacterium]MDB4356550.1 tRNA-guanine transglycosylase DpdA [Akkermansiaceae bacterium]MDB4373771.1 tRNA-guanine transglycosylase DpdA [Akkermansiaceae bacterium]MDB4562932.1 tRNA-guanine transglycosylase DpdA [Akkermansiaceae bacterium]
MKFYFAENCDTVDPDFDFIRDQPTPGRNRSHDLFAHEVLTSPPYDGLLVSRALVEGDSGSKRYSQAQKFRALREGLRAYFRYPNTHFRGDPFEYPIMGDCGSFSYVNKRVPPYTPEDTLEFYRATGVQYGVSPDHIILDYNSLWDNRRLLPPKVEERLNFTMNAASKFLESSRNFEGSFEPIGAIQCWSPRSAAQHALALVKLGYRYLGLGGLVSRKTSQIYDMVTEIRTVIPPEIKLHLFGFSRIDDLETFAHLGIDSFDSTSPMLKSFKDDEFNYFDPAGNHYLAIRIPSRNDTKVSQRIKAGDLDAETVRMHEEKALKAVRSYSNNSITVDEAVSQIQAYESLLRPGIDLRQAYQRTLEQRPWLSCPCAVCQKIGIEVILHRNLNRHKRRGFHNLHVLHQKVKTLRKMKSISLPCLRIKQSENRYIYSMAVNGKDIPKFASISRIGRNQNGDLEGYQRPEILTHIDDIRRYLELSNSVLPNALIIAFDCKLKFHPSGEPSGETSLGYIDIPLEDGKKSGWIVDGQQRMAALRQMSGRSITVPVTAIESSGIEDEREQFVLINNTRPLPKSLVYELLPSLGDSVPPKFRRRQKAYEILELLAKDPKSPFFQRIKTTTSGHLSNANIKDVSVLRMIENSADNGILARYSQSSKTRAKVLIQYWSAVENLFPEAWKLPPRESRLTHGAGIVSLGFLMDAIAFGLKQNDRSLATPAFQLELQTIAHQLAWTKGSWDLAPDMSLPWNEIQNTSRHIDLVTNFMIRIYRTGKKSPKPSSS